MRNIVLATVAALALTVAFDLPASASKKCTSNISCAQPTGVGKGKKAPVWRVSYCVVGKPSNYRKVNCKSPEALHRTPTGNMGVCFVGSDGKVHWDYQWVVHVGRPFINRKVDGRWQPDWQE
jgi:hypothetical protein